MTEITIGIRSIKRPVTKDSRGPIFLSDLYKKNEYAKNVNGNITYIFDNPFEIL